MKTATDTPTPTRWHRLWQPSRGVFWVMVVLNLLSSAGAWLLRAVELAPLAFALVALLSLGNAAAGLWLAARLWRGD